jgi:hypothetical protein
MANLSTFPARATVEDADQFVGYRAATSGGEGRWTAATLRAWVQAFTTKSSIGLGSVDNTADSAKPVSTAQAAAISAAQAAAIASASADATTKANAAQAAAIAASQPLDADLTAIAALTTTSFGRTFLTLADAAATRSALGLVIDSNVQSYSARLAAIAGLSTAADTLPYFTGASTAALATFTSTGRTLVAAADAAAGRSALGLVIGTHVQAYSSALATYAAIPPSANVQGFLAAADYAAMRTALGAGAASGLSTLDAGGKIPTAQIPDAVLGQVKFQGTWNAATNTPTLSGTPAATTKGDYYIVSTGGTQFSKTFEVGDWIISNGATQDKIDNTDAVTTVAGRIGNVTLTASDLTDGTAAGRTLFTAANAAAQRTALALVVGTDVQAYSANLAALAGITSAADRLPYFTGSGTATYANFTTYGRTLVAAADAAAGRTALGLATMALQAANNVAITGGAINGTTIGATTPSTGVFTSLTVNDNTTLGSSNSDTVNFNARIASDLNPSTDNTYDLGVPGHEWRNLHIDGTANIDSLVADTADINGGTIDGTAIGATTPSTAVFSTLYQGTAGAQGLAVGFSGAAGQGFTLRDTTNSRTYFVTTETATGLQINAGANPISLLASSVAVTGTGSYTGALLVNGAVGTSFSYKGLHATGPQFFGYDNVVGNGYGGGVRGYSVAAQGGYVALGTIQNNTWVPALTINHLNAATFASSVAVTGALSSTGTGTFGATSNSTGVAISSYGTSALVINSAGVAADTCLRINRGSGTYWLIAHDSLGGLTFNRDGADKAFFGRSGVDGLTVIGTLTTSSTTLHTSSVALTNGAGSSVGTLTNAPSVGNPTKWIPIVDNGTTRYIPAW